MQVVIFILEQSEFQIGLFFLQQRKAVDWGSGTKFPFMESGK